MTGVFLVFMKAVKLSYPLGAIYRRGLFLIVLQYSAFPSQQNSVGH